MDALSFAGIITNAFEGKTIFKTRQLALVFDIKLRLTSD